MEPNLRGPTSAEAAEARAQHGENVLTPPPRDPWWVLFREKLDDPVIRILMIATFISITVGVTNGHHIEGIGIIIATVLATGLAFINEFRANKEFDALNQSTKRLIARPRLAISGGVLPGQGAASGNSLKPPALALGGA